MTDQAASPLITLAQEKCKEWHQGQLRKYTHEPYHVHPFEVAKFLKDIGMPDEVLAAAYLHDVVEDCDVTEGEIIALFGDRVAELVMMVTDVSKPEDGNRKFRKNMDKDHLARADADGQSIKLADLISNSKSICEHDPGFARVYMREKKALLSVLTKGDKKLYMRALEIITQYDEMNGQQ